MSEDNATQTILVVDDTADNRDLIQRQLRRAGYRALVADGGLEGLALLDSEEIDLVILDVMMPGIDGIEVLRRIRRQRDANALPVIMATAKEGSETTVEALEHGANDYVTKPIDFPVLLARVQAHLRSRSSQAAEDEEIIEMEPGGNLLGKYRIEDELGAGNFGTVYRATHLALGEPVAIKVLKTVFDHSDEALARFQQEGASAFRLKHPNAVSVLDFHTTKKGFAFLVMEMLEGHTLEAELNQKGPLSVDRAGKILLPICNVLSEAHALGIIHRDIKPANIFLQRTRRGEVVKVLDFGIAKLVDDATAEKHLTLEEGVLGTPAYMAPERLQGGSYDGRADVYSLGVLLYQLLVGVPPFRAESNEAIAVAMMHLTQKPESLRNHRPEISIGLDSLVMETLRKDPSSRPTAAELASKLSSVLGKEIPETGPQPMDTHPTDMAGDLVTAPLPRVGLAKKRRRFDFSDLLQPPESLSLGPVDAPSRPGRNPTDPWTEP